MYSVNKVQVSEQDYYDIIAGVRGPDKITELDRDSRVNGYSLGDLLKSVTALVVRRALFGAERAMEFSVPSRPYFDELAGVTDMAIFYSVVPSHYISHARKALRALDRNACALKEDREPIKQFLARLDVNWF